MQSEIQIKTRQIKKHSVIFDCLQNLFRLPGHDKTIF